MSMGRSNRMLQDDPTAQETSMDQDWPGMLDEYGVQFLVLDRHADSDLFEIFRSQPGWTVDLKDEEAVIFTRAKVAWCATGRVRLGLANS